MHRVIWSTACYPLTSLQMMFVNNGFLTAIRPTETISDETSANSRRINLRSKCISQVVCQRAWSQTMEIWDCYWLQNLISIFDEVFCPKLKPLCSFILLCTFNPCGYLYFLDSSRVEHTAFTCICTMAVKSYSILFCLHWDCLQWWQALVFQWGRCGKHHHTASTKSFPHLYCTLTLRSNCCRQKFLHMFRFQHMCCRCQCHWAWQWIAVITFLRALKCRNIINMKYDQLHLCNMHVCWQSSYKGYRSVHCN